MVTKTIIITASTEKEAETKENMLKLILSKFSAAEMKKVLAKPKNLDTVKKYLKYI